MRVLVLRKRWSHKYDGRERREIPVCCGKWVLAATFATTIGWLCREASEHSRDKCERGQGRRTLARRDGRSCRSLRKQENDYGENHRMRNQRSTLCACRPQRLIKLQEMNRRAVCRRGFEMRRDKELTQVLSNPVQPPFPRSGFRRGIVAGKRTQKRTAHAQASVSASRFGPTTSGGGHQSANQKYRDRVWLPAEGILGFDEKRISEE
jgi:hypothetical protein